MIHQTIKQVRIVNILIWSALVIAVVFGAMIWYPKTLTAENAYQLQLVVAQRTCDKVNKLTNGLSNDPPLTADDCIQPNQYCELKWGANAVWAGASDEHGNPTCSCDEQYVWHNTDGTIGTTFGKETYDFISAPGRCVKQ